MWEDKQLMCAVTDCAEKVADEFAPPTVIEQRAETEEKMWQDSLEDMGPRLMLTNLRHRCCVLQLVSGILC